MIQLLIAFWRARTPRERRLLQGAAILVFGVLAPLWAYQSASAYRAHAAAALASARAVQGDVRRLAAAGAGVPLQEIASDGTLRGLAVALARANGLTVSRIEPAGPDRIRLALAPADSRKVYRWIDAVSRRGAAVEQTTMRRSGEGDEVIAEFEIAAR
jgi:type II secretory pathway component PulM